MRRSSYKFLIVMLVMVVLVGCSGQESDLTRQNSSGGKLKVELVTTEQSAQTLQQNNLKSFKVKVLDFKQENTVAKKSGIKLKNSTTAVVFGANIIENGKKYKVVVAAENNPKYRIQKETTKIMSEVTTLKIDLGGNKIEGQSIPGALRPSGVKVANQDGHDKGKIAVSWNPKNTVGPYPFKQNYVIYRSTTKQRPDEPLASQVEGDTYIDEDVKIDQKYYYWVAGQDPTNDNYISRPVGPKEITARRDTPYFERLSGGKFRFTFYPSKYDLYKADLPAETKVYLAGQMNNWGRPDGSLDQDEINSQYMDQLQEVGNVWSATINLSEELDSSRSYLEYKWYVDYGDNVVWYGFDGDSIENYPHPIGDGNPNTYEHDLYVKLKEGAQHPVFWWKEW